MSGEGLRHLGAGTRLEDNRTGRIIVLQQRVNPMGLGALPVWVVRNAVTGRRSVIRESRIDGRRWRRISNTEGKRER